MEQDGRTLRQENILKIGFAVAGVAVLALASSGLPQFAAIAAPARPAASWTIDKGPSRLNFQSSFGGTPFDGGFGSWGGVINFDPQNLAGSRVVIEINMASARAGDPSRDEALPTDDWFAVKRFPKATFTATTFKALGGNRFQAIGTLTIRGISRPLGMPFQLDIKGNRAHMQGQARLDRRLFGIGQGEFASAETVPFAVNVAVNLFATRGK